MKGSLNADPEQNNSLDELHKKREKWVEANRENDFEDGIKNLLTDLYPDNAHFIYELLQNAEDAGAIEVQFLLEKDKATFEHNGNRLFSQEDVEAITSIGYSTKKDDHTSIGKFGIGFKAVFAYTATPEIESGEFHFRIRDMVVPDTKDLFPVIPKEGNTLFTFPFNNPKKPPENAQAEIKRNLQELNENTLLFLSNIRRIDYHLPDSTKGYLELRKDENDDHRIEISTMRPGNLVPDSAHFLRFEKVVSVRDKENDELKDCKIAVAFGLEKTEKGEWKIKPLNPGQVCIYFPAVDEKSHLQFHMHAPFASTVARNSVRDYPANDELRDHLSVLVAESMHTIRDRGLLDVEFLSTLPNDRDHLSRLYLPIQKQLIKEFNQEKLVPMKQGGHATASEAYRTARGERDLSDLIEDKDLETLLGKDSSLPLWITNPPRLDSSREDNFLTMLDISEWTIEDLIEILETESDQVMEWLKQKDFEWHQDLYVLLDDFLQRAPSYPYSAARERKNKLSNLCIVRCIDDEYRTGDECHFPSDDVEPDQDLLTVLNVTDEEEQTETQQEENQEDNFYYVSHAVYSSGDNKNQQEKARQFLNSIGVSEVDDAERVKAILKQRYVKGTIPLREPHHKRDLEKFIDLVKEEPYKASLFKNYYIFELEKDGKRTWWHPHKTFIDTPYFHTGLKSYHEVLDKDSDSRKLALSPKYEKFGINLEKLVEFAKAIGVQTMLEVEKQKIKDSHPQYDYLVSSAPGQRVTDTSRNEDYTIDELDKFLLHLFSNWIDTLDTDKAVDKARLIWQTMCSQPHEHLEARYRKNAKYPFRVGLSSLVHALRKAKWVPQKDDDTISFVRPCDASRDQLPTEDFPLPKGYPDDAGDEWLKAIEFGKKTIEQKEEHAQRNQQAKDFGYDSSDEAEEVATIIKDWKAQGKTPEQLREKITPQKRREVMLIKELSDAPEKEYEERARNVRVSRGRIDPVTPLRTTYALDGKKMVCQICKHEMPFKKRNKDEDYFEAVEVLRKNHFPIEHAAQYLALCPVCSAKYKEYVKKDHQARQTLYNALKDSDVPKISLLTNGETIHIWFAEKHWHDLKVVLYFYENVYDHVNSTD